MPPVTAPVNEETLITIKVSFDDSIKKLKLPLKDLGATVLPDKVGRLKVMYSRVYPLTASSFATSSA